MHLRAALVLTLLVAMPVMGRAQASAPATQATPAEPGVRADTIDVSDLLRTLRHKPAGPEAPAWDYRQSMKAFAPVIGAKPSSGVLFGAAGNVAF